MVLESKEGTSVTSVVGYARPYDQWDGPYQAFYRQGLDLCLQERGNARLEIAGVTAVAPILRLLRRVRDCGPVSKVTRGRSTVGKAFDAVAHMLTTPVVGPSNTFVSTVGQYLITLRDGSTRRICIDASDTPTVLHGATLMEWADVYYKANMWPSHEYPGNVKPVVNGNPVVSRDERQLRALRGQTPEYDVCCIMQVRAGSSDEGIEHCVRLLEALSRLRCRKYLCGILSAGDIPAQIRRLERCGVAWMRRGMPLATLRHISARSRINVIRLGVHYCIPWRTVELLSFGCAIAIDREPFSRWPEPLAAGKHFLDLSLGVGPDHCLASTAEYENVVQKIESWLADTTLVRQVAANAADYFDRHAAPARVGAYLLDSCIE